MTTEQIKIVILFMSIFSIQACIPLEKTQKNEEFKILKEYNNKKIILKNNVLLFSTDKLKVDIDGSRYAYGIADQGVEHICNGLSPVEPKRCQNVPQTNKNGCLGHCKKQFKEWYKNGHKLEKINDYMRSIGLGGSNGSRVELKLQENNNTMFLSHTSVSYNREESNLTEQEAQIESFSVPFFVIPAGLRLQPWDATPGDFGVAVHAQDSNKYAFFVVGDIGGNLDEGSVKLQELLGKKGGVSVPNIFGKKVDRYGNNTLDKFNNTKKLDLRIAIFRNTSSLQDIKSQKNMLMEIKRIGEKKLEEFGGIEKIILYTTKVPESF